MASHDFAQLRDLPERRTIEAGTLLVEQGATAASVHLICSGLLRLSYVGPEGAERTLGLRTSGWYAGAPAVIMNVPSVCSATCIGPCTVATVPAAEFTLRLMGNAKLLRHFIRTMCSEITAQASAQAQLMSSSAEDRLECFLRECQAKDPRWNVVDPLPMLKQMELAQLLAIEPETLSRIIHKRQMGGRLPLAPRGRSAGSRAASGELAFVHRTPVQPGELNVGFEELNAGLEAAG